MLQFTIKVVSTSENCFFKYHLSMFSLDCFLGFTDFQMFSLYPSNMDSKFLLSTVYVLFAPCLHWFLLNVLLIYYSQYIWACVTDPQVWDYKQQKFIFIVEEAGKSKMKVSSYQVWWWRLLDLIHVVFSFYSHKTKGLEALTAFSLLILFHLGVIPRVAQGLLLNLCLMMPGEPYVVPRIEPCWTASNASIIFSVLSISL